MGDSRNTLKVSVPVTTAWRMLRLLTEERLPGVKVSCENTKQAVADRRQGVVL